MPARMQSVPSDIPDPPYPPDTRVRGWRFELDLERIRRSDTWALCPQEIRPWLLMLWAVAWEQCPAGSLPSDHRLIAAHAGMPERLFAAHADLLLRGFLRHSDGRLYHSVVSEQVLALVTRRDEEAKRKAAYRAAKLEQEDQKCPTGQTRDRQGTPGGIQVESGHQNQNQNQNQKRSRARALEIAELDATKNRKTADKAPRSPTGSRFTLEELPDAWREYFAAKRPNADPTDTWEDFRDYWVAMPGQRGRKLDWFATWRGWVRRQRPIAGRRATESSSDRAARVAEEFWRDAGDSPSASSGHDDKLRRAVHQQGNDAGGTPRMGVTVDGQFCREGH